MQKYMFVLLLVAVGVFVSGSVYQAPIEAANLLDSCTCSQCYQLPDVYWTGEEAAWKESPLTRRGNVWLSDRYVPWYHETVKIAGKWYNLNWEGEGCPPHPTQYDPAKWGRLGVGGYK